MAKAQKITAYSMPLDDRPGALLELMKTFKEKKVNLAGIWGYTMGPGQAEVLIVGKDPEKVRAALSGAGKQFTTRTVFYTKGDDKVGALLDSLQSLADAGVNLDAANAIGVGGTYGAYFWINEADAARTEGVLAKKK